MLTKKRKHLRLKKAIALFMLFTIANQILAPTVAYALTAGPTAPEATNFEPIDTTDMVNPLTGDLTYSLPLIEVPGPEGGYPLALSYHAGIQPNEEASWVGLGWSLNAGAIARNVNGYPDDWNNATGTERDYWNGGHTETFGVDVGYGLFPGSPSFGLSFSEDTYRGFGIGVSLGEEFGIKGTPFAVSIGESVSSNGGGGIGVDLSVSSGKVGADGFKGVGSIGVQTNFSTVSASATGGVSYQDGGSRSTLGASISTTGVSSAFISGDGARASVNNANANKLSTSSFGITIPTPWGFSLSYNYERYWSDETTNFTANGVLYSRASINAKSDLDNSGDDNYQLLDPNHTNIVDNPDPLTVLGGTFPDFDNYSVTGQGLGGYMRPYIFSAILYNQNRINTGNHHSNDVYAEQLPSAGVVNNKWQFRFINDFSNSYTQGNPWGPTQNYYFDNNPQFGNNDGYYGYDHSTNRLEGSKHIEYFTNDQIINGYAAGRGFIDCSGPQTAGFTRRTGNQIGGFMITNPSGVTYHYALPAYNSNELVHTEQISRVNGYHFNDLHKNNSYAYTWYLTAITGPDYVSRGYAPGTITPDDWGYWVKFDYGQWTGSYGWRNPSQGFQRDLDNAFQNYSSGTKELYYLDAIETRTHTALFVKNQRNDAKSIGTSGSFDNTSVSSLNLSYILLLKNDQFSSTISLIRNVGTLTSSGANAHNVIDVSDIGQLSETLNQACLRKIAFNYDNSLCPGVPNSFAAGAGSNTTNLGKLTLLSVDLQGKSGVSMQPPIQFQYDLDATNTTNQDNISVTQASANQAGTNQSGKILVQTNNKFKVGDIISFAANGQTYYCTLMSTTDHSNFNVLFLNNSPGGLYSNLPAVRTKNPPYNKDGYDNWNNYKSDYMASPNGNENLSRFTTAVSNSGADAWSLRNILSSLGANVKINYEGDTYNKSVLNKNRSLILSSFTRNSPGNYTFSVNNENADLTKVYHVGDKIDLILEKQAYTDMTSFIYISNGFKAINSDSYPTPAIVQAINNSSTLTVTVDPNMDNDVTTLAGFTYYNYAGSAVLQGTTPVSGEQTKIFCGNVSANGANLFYGGGLRVKDIIVDDLNGSVKKTSYNYCPMGRQNDPTSSSGVTSYEPLVFDQTKDFLAFSPFYNVIVTASNYPGPVIQREVYKDINKMLAVSRELPPPGVMYATVAVADSTILTNGASLAIGGRTVFQYEVFKPEMVGITDYQYDKPTAGGTGVHKQTSSDFNPIIDSSSRRGMIIKDFTSRVGNLKRVITYDNLGNKLTEKINHYLHDDLDNTNLQNQIANYEPRLLNYNGVAYNNIGVIKETYGNTRVAVAPGHVSWTDWTNDWYDDLFVMSNKQTFPSIQTGTTQIDYKNGTRVDQTNLAYDFYSGAVTQSLTTDSYGNRFINQITPAYMAGGVAFAHYPALGLKTQDDDPTSPNYTGQHKQMLTQQAANYTFAVDASNNRIGVVSATVQTWSNSIGVFDPNGNSVSDGSQANIWRMEKSYVWMPSGSSANNLAPYSSFADYYLPGTTGSSNASWKKTGQVTQYNVYSSALEASDINNTYAATRMGYNNTKVLITGTMARYNEIAYAGAEDALLSNGYFSNQISPGGGTVVTDSTKAHTGVNSLMVPASANGFTYTVPATSLNLNNQVFKVSVWVKPSGGNISGAQLYYQTSTAGTQTVSGQATGKTAAGWYLLEIMVPNTAITSGNLVVGCTNSSTSALYFDDFRFEPAAAKVTAYVYDNQTGDLSYILDNNNLYTRFQYDAIGRLVRTYREVIGKPTAPLINSLRYHYAKNGNVN